MPKYYITKSVIFVTHVEAEDEEAARERIKTLPQSLWTEVETTIDLVDPEAPEPRPTYCM